MTPWYWGFRRGLKHELAEWEAEGLVTPETAETLRERYSIESGEAAEEANLAVYILGSLLIFGGVLSFVAWNWVALPGAAKVGLGLAFMLGAEGLGFWFGWVDGRRPGLGHALIFLGALGFGANLAIFAQVWHFEPGPEGYLLWAVASAGLAVALRSLPCAMLTAVTINGWLLTQDQAQWPGGLLLPHFVWIGLLAWGLAGFRSAALSTGALVGGAITVGAFSLQPPMDLGFAAVFHVPLAFATAGVGIGPNLSRGGHILMRISGGVVVALAFIASFSSVAQDLAEASRADRLGGVITAGGPAFALGFAAALRLPDLETRRQVLAGFGVALLFLLSGWAGAVPVLFCAHLCIVARVAWDLRRSLSEHERGPFWSALLLGVGTISARFLEIQTDLLTKAAAFILAGLAVLIAGFLFERRRKESAGED